MKKHHSIIGIFLLLMQWVSTETASAQLLNWQYQSLLTDSRQSATNHDFEVDSLGNLYLSYWDKDNDRLTFAKRDANTFVWSFQVPDPQILGGYVSSMVVDANLKVHIAYYQNDNGTSRLRYVSNTTGNWVGTSIAPDSALGVYGLNNNTMEFFKPSIDMVLRSDGTPFITCFNATFLTDATGLYCPYSNYKLKPMIAYKNAGAWTSKDMDDAEVAPDKFWCSDDGDRFGEFMKALPRNNGGMRLVSNSFFNRTLNTWVAPTNNLGGAWTSQIVDSIRRFALSPATVAIDWSSTYKWMSFEQVAATQFKGDDNVGYLLYNNANMYGIQAHPGAVPRRLMFCQVKWDSIGVGTYTPFYRQVNTSVTANDGVRRTQFELVPYTTSRFFVPFSEENTGRIILAQTTVGGASWTFNDTIATYSTDVKIQAKVKYQIFNDSLMLTVFNTATQKIVLYAKRVADVGNPGVKWVEQNITNYENRATYISAKITEAGVNDKLHIAFDERNEDVVYYGYKNGANAWVYTKIGNPNSEIKGVQLDLNTTTQPLIAYVEGDSNRITVAKKPGGTWTYEYAVNDPNIIPRQISMKALNGEIYIAYNDLNSKSLYLAKGTFAGATWSNSIVDSIGISTGQKPSLAVDANGVIHIAYWDVAKNQLKYARKPTTGNWVRDTLTTSNIYVAGDIKLVLNSAGEPSIAFYDGNANAIMYVEKSGSTWTTTKAQDFGSNGLIGNPFRILMDVQNRPWILYNYADGINVDLRLSRRDASGAWYSVSVNNNDGNIGNSFDFILSGLDFYIFGKKNANLDNGVAMLTGVNGVNTDIALAALLEQLQLKLVPNPAQNEVSLQFHTPQAVKVGAVLYNLNGQAVAELPVKNYAEGEYQQSMDIAHLPNGVYFCKWILNDTHFTQKLIVIH